MKSTPKFTCDICRVYSPGVHWIEPEDPHEQPYPVPCPAKLAAELHEQAVKLTETQNEAVKEAAHRIVADAAHGQTEFSANTIRDALDAAQVPGSVVGGAFRWACNQGLIEKTGRRVMSDEASTRHEIDVWRSLVYGKRAGAA